MLATTTAVLNIVLHAQILPPPPRPVLPQAAPGAVRATAQLNRVPAGRLAGELLTLGIDIVESAWRPEGADAPEVPLLAFAESGKAPTVPGPLIRARQGTTVALTLRNRTDSALVLTGLRPGAALATDTVWVAAGATRTLRVRLDSVGTFHYRGAFKARPGVGRGWKDSQLNGAIVVDAPGASTDDHILIISEWFYGEIRGPGFEATFTINGQAWPHTERMQFQQGDSVRFRVINLMGFHHPMHLHGFFYTIESRGDGRRDTPVPEDRRSLSNTDLLPAGGTYTLRFVASTPGNWLYHCHFAFHINEEASLHGAATDSIAAARATAQRLAAHAEHVASDVPVPTDPEHMRGLVIGIKVVPRPGYVATSTAGARRMDLYAQEAREALNAGGTLRSFVLQRGDAPPARDSVVFPSSVLELRRGEPVRIVVHNNLREPTAVHWHGLEIESFPDGVPHWSGLGDRIFTQIAPNDSFAAEFTPPRAGTYPYHSHLNDRGQLTSGLYGAVIVTDAPRDLAHDHLVVIGGAGPWVEHFLESPYGAVNGDADPPPLRLTAGEAHRLRFVTLHPDWAVDITLQNDTTVARWTPFAKDGADLPPALRTPRTARVRMGAGETADFMFTPTEPGDWVINVATDFAGGWQVRQRVTVVARP